MYPQHYTPNILKALNGANDRLLMLEFGQKLNSKLCCRHLLNPSYFLATVSENTEQQIK